LGELQRTVEKYRSSNWIYGYKATDGRTFTKICKYKTAAGLLRIHVKVFENILEQILLTGDFFAYPSTAIHELEANLKWIAVDDVPQKVIEFADRMTIHGLSIYELANLIENCIKD
ncbi:MAG: hypothetical protein QXK04_06325, partial [Ignisphaera sp.]